MTKYTATFTNGDEITRTSHREYAAAWAVYRDGEIFHSGFSGSVDLAISAANACRSLWITEDPDARLRKAKTLAERKYVLESIERAGGADKVRGRRAEDLEAFRTEVTNRVARI